MTTVAVTGASGYLGQGLLSVLATHPEVSRVVGIDRVEPRATTRNLEFYRMDIRSPDLSRVLRDSAVIVHLAFLADGDPAEMKDVNVGGTRLVLDAAAEAGARKVVVASSTLAYGAHPDNDFPLTERSPLRPVAGVPLSDHHAEAEELVRSFGATHPDLATVILRLCPVAGPHLDGTAARFVESPYALAVRGYEAPGQVLHEDDAARALLVATMTDLAGVYNVCPDDHASAAEMRDVLGQRIVELDPERVGRAAARPSWLRLGGVSADLLPFLMYPCVASNAKLRTSGFAFEHASLEALRAAADARKGWVAVGDVHFRPRRIAIAGGAIAALVLGGAVRRSRRSRA